MTAQRLPPILQTDDGRPRRVGVEIEFTGVDTEAAAGLVQTLFGGAIETLDKHRLAVRQTRFGDFEVELDASFAHPTTSEGGAGEDEAGLSSELEAKLRATVGDLASVWLPIEIVGPPVPLRDLPAFDDLVAALRAHHAEGTRASPLYGFGVQLNPEVASTHADDILRHLKAYLVLSPWLRQEIDVDPTRRLLPFADPFPEAYVRAVLSADYGPSLAQLIDDYLDANPTRNRELDLLPLFAHVDDARVRRRVPDPRIKARPTFHYRLPNSSIDDPNWGGIVSEWNRWVEVERLASDQARLCAAAVDRLAGLDAPGRSWRESIGRWLGG